MCIGIVPSTAVLCQTEQSFIASFVSEQNLKVPWTGQGRSKNPVSVLAFTSNNLRISGFYFSDHICVGITACVKLKSLHDPDSRSYLQYSVPFLKVRHVALLTQGSLSFKHCSAVRDKRPVRKRHFISLTIKTLDNTCCVWHLIAGKYRDMVTILLNHSQKYLPSHTSKDIFWSVWWLCSHLKSERSWSSIRTFSLLMKMQWFVYCQRSAVQCLTVCRFLYVLILCVMLYWHRDIMMRMNAFNICQQK